MQILRLNYIFSYIIFIHHIMMMRGFFLIFDITRTADNAAGFSAGVYSILDHGCPIDKDMAHA